jgi:hypothetical protein
MLTAIKLSVVIEHNISKQNVVFLSVVKLKVIMLSANMLGK